MSRTRPSETEIKILRVFFRYHLQHDDLSRPTTEELAKQIQVTPSAISQAKRRLKRHGLLTEADELTERAMQLPQLRLEVLPVEVPLAGEVQAGRRRSDDLKVYMVERSQLGDPSLPRVAIPASDAGATTVAFLVRGASMEDHKIYDGDFVLVELFEDGQDAKDGELVVTRYLSPADSDLLDHMDDTLAEGIAMDYMEGPTIKYYYRRQDHIRLSPTINPDQHPSTIRTKMVRSIGRVVGVYRKI